MELGTFIGKGRAFSNAAPEGYLARNMVQGVIFLPGLSTARCRSAAN